MQAHSWYCAPALHRLGFTNVGNAGGIFKLTGFTSYRRYPNFAETVISLSHKMLAPKRAREEKRRRTIVD